MNIGETEVRDLLRDFIQEDGTLDGCDDDGMCIQWDREAGVHLDGEFGWVYLEAIVWWMKNTS